LTTSDVDFISTIVEDRMPDIWENVNNHKASILEQIQEVKNVLEQLKVKIEQQQQKTSVPTKEGISMGETVQITTQGSVNFRITLYMLFMDE
jgi:uncharacterized protein (DUF342 family)